MEPDVLRSCRAGEQHEHRVFDKVITKIVDPAGRIEDHVLWTEALLHGMSGLLPAHRDAAFQYKIDVTVPEWGKRLVCSQCGSRNVDFVVSGAKPR